ncbi:hypothetical protein [Parasediminibacterium sp. JCM 36343]|uniref:hypothetical protein n=1 Tax=Parasediminibacterium sp. JCM 36343 TaxID=3374279 RepID=UPI00397A9958
MKKVMLISGVAIAAILFTISGCKKNDTATAPSVADETTLQTNVSANAADQTNVQNDDDAIANDASRASDAVAPFDATTVSGGATSDSSTVAGAVIDKSPLKQGVKKFFIRYIGANGFGVTKSGKVTVELINGSKWTDKGAVLKETLDSVQINYNGKTRIYNGTRYVTNVSGGYMYTGILINPNIYTVHAYGTVTFEDNSTRTYWAARKNTFNKTTATFTSSGDTTVNGDTCTIGGTSRFNKPFLVKAPQTYVASFDCNYFRNPIAGVRTYVSDGRNVTITFGVDVSGNQVTSGCAYGYNITWTKLNGQSKTITIKY